MKRTIRFGLQGKEVAPWIAGEPGAGSATAAAQCKLGDSQVCSGGLGAA